MAPVRKRRRSGTPTWVRALLGISVPALGVLVAVVVLGKLEVPFLDGSAVLAWTRRETTAEDPGPPPGTVPLPRTRTSIPAYTAITREHWFDFASGQPLVVHLPESAVTERMVTMADVAAGKLNGRVLRREKGAGYVFTWEDFLPEGARSGVVGGIPPGKRGMWVEVGRVRGLSDLKVGDRFDVVAALAQKDATIPVNSAVGGFYADQVTNQPRLRPKTPKPTVEVVVQNGLVVVPERTREIPVTSSGLMTGQRISSRPVREVMIAVEAVELASLTAALAAEGELWCAPRSGHPEEDPDAATVLVAPSTADDRDASARRFTTVEVIEGASRRQLTTPRATHDG